MGGPDDIGYVREVDVLAGKEVPGSGDHQDVAVAGRGRAPGVETLIAGSAGIAVTGDEEAGFVA